MITSVILLAVSLTLVGIGLQIMRTLTKDPSPKQEGPSVTVSGKNGVVTLRNAAGGDLQVFFSNRHSPEEEHVIPYSEAQDRVAEEEVTILDELRNPATSPIRRAEIESELLSLGYRIVPQGRQVTTDTTSGAGVPTNSQYTEGTDEGLGEQEPDFESFYVQSD